MAEERDEDAMEIPIDGTLDLHTFKHIYIRLEPDCPFCDLSGKDLNCDAICLHARERDHEQVIARIDYKEEVAIYVTDCTDGNIIF